MLFTMAWRNIWRNRRRTFITLASIAFAVFFASFMQSIQKGAWDHMLDNVVNFYYGYAQVQDADYWEEQSLDQALVWTPELEQSLLKTEGIQHVAPRLESFALAAGTDLTTGVLVVGVQPEAEDQLTKLSERITEGRYWPAGAHGALVATGVMERLGLSLGDSIILLSQGYHGVNSAGKYPIVGVLKFGSPDLNKRMVYLPRQEAEQFFGADGMATTLALDIDHKEEVPAVIRQLNTTLDTSQFAILGWEEMIPDLVDAKELDAAGNNLVLIVLYLIISFGIFGTILMMTRERSYEFGVLTGIGMHRWQLGITVWLEIILLGFLGTIIGILLSLPLVYYLKLNPIDLSIMGEEAVETYEKFGMEPILPALVDPAIFFWQAVIVFSITTILALYPWWKISQLAPIAAMREA
jgi:ABC-type lipoprotein release transport system permease subunit